ncbi:DEAD/DEAH box helicase [Mameliella sp.]|uniref:DEAD/DEAH box helicase n=1 Tax=Mameliella sp. TaxID=1924940 RepID=UPI003B50B810
MPITPERIISALKSERAAAQVGLVFKVLSTRRQGELALITAEPVRDGRRSSALDESLEDSKAVWFGDLPGRGKVVAVDPDRGELALKYVSGPLPEVDSRLTLYPEDFLTPLIELWDTPCHLKKAAKLLKRAKAPAAFESKPLPAEFNQLRERQSEAVSLPLSRVGLLHGPPGTGKTYTIGGMIAYLLTRFPDCKILVSGPTNTAVDSALLSADDWLQKIGREDLRETMKRIGSRFETGKFSERDHLLPSGVYAASVEVGLLESEEPSKTDIEKYVIWKEKLADARKRLKVDIAYTCSQSRLIAITTNSFFRHFDDIPKGWHFALADEASQIPLPAALMVASKAHCVTFAGDPKQLAPIVQTDDISAETILGKTAFDVFKEAPSVFLNEQSRMCQGVCDVVSHTFYDDQLIVCQKAARDAAWKKDRSPWFLNGREMPRVMVDDRAGEATWSKKYNGKIRYQSAEIIAAMIDELLGSYAEPDDIMILTPFRAQRALIRGMLGRGGRRNIKVSTVHRAQGSEKKIVIFDPVDAGSSFLNSDTGRRLINVAASRAQAHFVLLAGPADMRNRFITRIAERSRAIWDRRGDYASPLRVRLRSA